MGTHSKTTRRSGWNGHFSSIFKKNIIKEEGYRDDILSKFSGGSDSSLPDESLKIKPLHVSQDISEKSPQKNILVR